jgi:hypothetical protein
MSSRLRLVLLLLLGFAVLGLGFRWCRGFRRVAGSPETPASAVGATSQPAAIPSPDPTSLELAMLDNPDAGVRRQGLAVLRDRRPTPEMEAAVDRSLERPENEPLRMDLVCLKARFPGPETLELALASLPVEKGKYGWSLDEGTKCVVRDLAARSGEAPERIAEVLILVAISRAGSTAELGLEGLKTIDLPQLPSSLLVRLETGNDYERLRALNAALALGAISKSPELVERALSDPYHGVRGVAARALQHDDDPAAARMLAHALVHPPIDTQLMNVFSERERRRHDISPALVEIALDAQAPVAERQSAMEFLARYGDPAAADALAALAQSPDEALRAYAEATIAELRRRGGR